MSDDGILYGVTKEQVQEFAECNWGRVLSDHELESVRMNLAMYDSDFIGDAIGMVLDKQAVLHE